MLTIRKIQEKDLFNGFLDSLSSLKDVNLDESKAKRIFKEIQKKPDHVIFVAEMDGKIVGTTTLLIEQKFIHSGGKVGHIEDVAVTKEKQGQKIGLKLVKTALEYAKKQQCYKTILDCSDEVKEFYEKLGFKHHSNGMRYDH